MSGWNTRLPLHTSYSDLGSHIPPLGAEVLSLLRLRGLILCRVEAAKSGKARHGVQELHRRWEPLCSRAPLHDVLRARR